MAETRTPSVAYECIAGRLIAEEEILRPIAESGVAIAYLSSDAARKSNGKTVFGACERVPAKWRWAVPFDFAITVFEPNVAGFDEERLRILLFHELLHVGIARDGGEERYSIIPHDLEEFREVSNRYGLAWHTAPPGAPSA